MGGSTEYREWLCMRPVCLSGPRPHHWLIVVLPGLRRVPSRTRSMLCFSAHGHKTRARYCMLATRRSIAFWPRWF